jgi:hypothetical protein
MWNLPANACLTHFNPQFRAKIQVLSGSRSAKPRRQPGKLLIFAPRSVETMEELLETS